MIGEIAKYVEKCVANLDDYLDLSKIIKNVDIKDSRIRNMIYHEFDKSYKHIERSCPKDMIRFFGAPKTYKLLESPDHDQIYEYVKYTCDNFLYQSNKYFIKNLLKRDEFEFHDSRKGHALEQLYDLGLFNTIIHLYSNGYEQRFIIENIIADISSLYICNIQYVKRALNYCIERKEYLSISLKLASYPFGVKMIKLLNKRFKKIVNWKKLDIYNGIKQIIFAKKNKLDIDDSQLYYTKSRHISFAIRKVELKIIGYRFYDLKYRLVKRSMSAFLSRNLTKLSSYFI